VLIAAGIASYGDYREYESKGVQKRYIRVYEASFSRHSQ
jgi:hypothetical protein